MNAGSGSLITGKIGMSSKFLDMGKLNSANDSSKIQSSRRASVLPNPLAFSNRTSVQRKGLNLASNNQMN